MFATQRFNLFVLAIAFLASWRVLAAAQASAGPERFTAAAINMNRGDAGSVEIVIDRWSTDAERDRLMKAMFDKGPEKLLEALQGTSRKGYFRAPNSLGWDVHFARRVPLPDRGE